MRTAILVFIALFMVVPNLMAAEVTKNYKNIISKIEAQEGRRELASCIRRWAPKTKNAALVDAYRNGFSSDYDGFILESGNAGWGGYLFAYVWKSQGEVHVWTNIGDQGIDGKFFGGPLIAFSEALAMIASKSHTLNGLAHDADDAPCYFVRAKSGKKIVEFAVVAPRSEGELADEEVLVNKILQLVTRRGEIAK